MGIAIKVENLFKAYRLGEIGTGTISRDLERWLAKLRGKEDPFLRIGEENDRTTKGTSDVVWSLKDINFEIHQGEAVGVIGRNGAGKSTLLKLLSRVTAPTTGTIKAKGRIASLLEVGTGFHPELTGRENIYLNGAILGMRKKEIDRKFDEIVDFSGVERYIDTPVKRYSSGMYVRLAFGVAAHLESEILIVDEVLAVGDAEFQKKCLGKMKDVSSTDGRTILFVSHNMGAVNQLCNTAILLVNGRLDFEGSTAEVVSHYLTRGIINQSRYTGPDTSSKVMWFKSIVSTDSGGNINTQYMHDEDVFFQFEIGFNIKKDKHNYSIFVMVLSEDKSRVFAAESDIVCENRITLKIKKNFLVRGNYSIHTFIHKPQTEAIDTVEDVCAFTITDNGSPLNIHGAYDYGKVFGRHEWVL
jgi:lipopolysaccharide transport system ATP-binding protein